MDEEYYEDDEYTDDEVEVDDGQDVDLLKKFTGWSLR